ncbi:amidohydrolase [Rossellomorea vietnamensis]|uniref:Amidohydrolase n=1 Tax=Rossellomorea vietnamensis TaxID=218284 RepID=A0A5D4MD24_9BACI|nr:MULTISPECIES: M20 family metallopeptidase [Bacillaceae]TYR99516.1 amidohydrolase [Rossellomorea vietnamensis]
MLDKLRNRLESDFDEMVEIRRYMHQNPELSFKEEKTAQYITDFYRQLDIEVTPGVGGNGVVARIQGGKPGKTIALRADFDALPIQDEKKVPYRSKIDGVMHACGHDGHTAALLILARAMNEMKEELPGSYVFIHQHAEEYAPGGAKPMVEAGCLDGVDAVFGTHLWATEPLGKIQYRTGPIMAAADRFEIVIQGAGGHGAQPHKTKDSIVTASQLTGTLQQIVSRRVNPIEPAVVTIGSFVAENAFNVIADTAKLAGTVRTFSEETRDFIISEMERIIKGTCLSADCSYSFEYDKGYPAVVNHKEETEHLIKAAEGVNGVSEVEECEMQMGGEDFAYYLQKVPGTFFFTGAKPEGVEIPFPHHHPKFDFNEKAMLTAACVLANAAITYAE